jgi:hypothetical protein
VLISIGGLAFAQDSSMEIGAGFQYGLASLKDEDGKTVRKIQVPGALGTFRYFMGDIGFFGRFGVLLPPSVTEGELKLDWDHYDYILFFNGGLGVSFKMPVSNQFELVFDVGMGINDLTYQSSGYDNIMAAWEVKIEQLGITYSGGTNFYNVKMNETYNDFSFCLLDNVAFLMNFNRNISLELGVAVGYDFLRRKTYNFSADFKEAYTSPDKSVASKVTPDDISSVFVDALVDDTKNYKVNFEESKGKMTLGRQLTFIPSLSVIFRL